MALISFQVSGVEWDWRRAVPTGLENAANSNALDELDYNQHRQMCVSPKRNHPPCSNGPQKVSRPQDWVRVPDTGDDDSRRRGANREGEDEGEDQDAGH